MLTLLRQSLSECISDSCFYEQIDVLTVAKAYAEMRLFVSACVFSEAKTNARTQPHGQNYALIGCEIETPLGACHRAYHQTEHTLVLVAHYAHSTKNVTFRYTTAFFFHSQCHMRYR